MTTSDHTKVLKQIAHKPAKFAKWKKHNTPRPRKYGKMAKKCKVSGATRGVIHKYGLNVCRKWFKQHASELGFKKYD